MNTELTVYSASARPQFIPPLTTRGVCPIVCEADSASEAGCYLVDGALRQRREATLPPSEAVRGASCG